MGKAIWACIPEWGREGRVTFSGSERYETQRPPEKLLTADPWNVARFVSAAANVTRIDFETAEGSPTGAVFLDNHNLSGAGQVRFQRSAGSIQDPLPLPPAAVEGSPVNMVVDLATLDEDPYADGGDWSLATSPVQPIDVRLSFATPSPGTSLRPGKGLQQFVIRARKTESSTGDQRILVDLYEGGVLRRSLVKGSDVLVQKGGDGQVILVPWDAEDLADAEGTDVEIRISCSGPPGSIDLGAVRWLAEIERPGVEDSGWMDAWPSAAQYSLSGLAPADRVGQLRNFAVWFPEQNEDRFFRIELRDEGNPAGYLQAGGLRLGPRAEFPGVKTGARLEWVSLGKTQRSPYTGAAFPQERGGYRKFSGDFPPTEEGDYLYPVFAAAAYHAGERPFLFSLDPEDVEGRFLKTVWGQLSRHPQAEFLGVEFAGGGFTIEEV